MIHESPIAPTYVDSPVLLPTPFRWRNFPIPSGWSTALRASWFLLSRSIPQMNIPSSLTVVVSKWCPLIMKRYDRTPFYPRNPLSASECPHRHMMPIDPGPMKNIWRQHLDQIWHSGCFSFGQMSIHRRIKSLLGPTKCQLEDVLSTDAIYTLYKFQENHRLKMDNLEKHRWDQSTYKFYTASVIAINSQSWFHELSIKSKTQIDLIRWNCVPPKQVQSIADLGYIGMGVYKGSDVIRRRVPWSVTSKILDTQQMQDNGKLTYRMS